MLENKSPLKIDGIASAFANLLRDGGTSLEQPSFKETLRAFLVFCQEPIACDDDRLFFEADLSSTHPDSFYVHFARTCYGREPKGHLWSYEIIGDFLFPLDEELEEFQCTIEAEDLVGDSEDRQQFIAEVQSQEALLSALSQRQSLQGQIYIGES